MYFVCKYQASNPSIWASSSAYFCRFICDILVVHLAMISLVTSLSSCICIASFTYCNKSASPVSGQAASLIVWIIKSPFHPTIYHQPLEDVAKMYFEKNLLHPSKINMEPPKLVVCRCEPRKKPLLLFMILVG